MKNISISLLTGFLLFFFACEKKKDASLYENCCGATATADTVHMKIFWPDGQGGGYDSTVVGRVYIPNIFTPSSPTAEDDGLFIIFGNEWVNRIVSVKYYAESGELLFSNDDFYPNDSGASWTGKNSDGTVYKGGFTYDVIVEFSDGHMKTYTNKACAFQCGDPGFPMNRLPDCLFPNQNNGYGAPDQTLPQPPDCF